MKRYQIAYSKNGYPLTAWEDSTEKAHKTAELLRANGYAVEVWERTETGSKITKL